MTKFWFYCLLLLLGLLCWQNAKAQEVKFSGNVFDNTSKEPITGCNIYLPEFKKGTTTDNSGYFVINVPKGKTKISFSFVGYNRYLANFQLLNDTILNIYLNSENQIREVTVSEQKRERIITPTYQPISVKKIKELPLSMGEPDIFKYIQFMPAVMPGTEASSGYYIRGGDAGQNLVLIDGMLVFNTSHMIQNISVVNSEIIDLAKFYCAGFPARYGERLSSVLDIRLKNPDLEKIKAQASVSNIFAKANAEIPIIKGKTALLVAARKSVTDLYAKKLIDFKNGLDYGFYDINLKLYQKINNSNNITINYFNSNDYQIYIDKLTGKDYSRNRKYQFNNQSTAIKWESKINENLQSKTSIGYTTFNYYAKHNEGYENSSEENDKLHFYHQKYNYDSEINDLNIKTELEYSSNVNSKHILGTYYSKLTNRPGRYFEEKKTTSRKTIFIRNFLPDGTMKIRDTTFTEYNINEIEFTREKEQADDINLYYEFSKEFPSGWLINAGLHSSFYFMSKCFAHIEPRLLIEIPVNKFKLHLTYSKTNQSLHFIKKNMVGSPMELWKLASENAKPQVSHIASSGISFQSHNGLFLSVDLYYKTMKNLSEFKEGYSFFNDISLENSITQGRGLAYGTEVQIKKETDYFSGFINYTLAKSARKFTELNLGRQFHSNFDRLHSIKCGGSVKITSNINIFASWIYASGAYLSVPKYKFIPYNCTKHLSNYIKYVFCNERNNYQLPAYHTLDLGANLILQSKKIKQEIGIGATNVYNHKNISHLDYYTYFEQDDEEFEHFYANYLYSFLPYLTYSISF